MATLIMLAGTMLVVIGCGSNSVPIRESVEATVEQLKGEPAVCEAEGFALLEGGNAPVFGCSVDLASPPRRLGCFAVVDDVIYDVTLQLRASAQLGRTRLPCTRR